MNIKFNLYFLVIFLFVSENLAVYTTELKSNFDEYNVAVAYKIKENETDFQKCLSTPFGKIRFGKCITHYDTEIYVEKSAVGMPIYFNNRIISSQENKLEFIVDPYYSNSIYTQNPISYNKRYWTITEEDALTLNDCKIWLSESSGDITYPTFPRNFNDYMYCEWKITTTPKNRIHLSIGYHDNGQYYTNKMNDNQLRITDDYGIWLLVPTQYTKTITSKYNNITLTMKFSQETRNRHRFHVTYNTVSEYETISTQSYTEEYTTTEVENIEAEQFPQMNESLSSDFNISWTPDRTSEGCISLTYKMQDDSNQIYLKIFEEKNNTPIITHYLEYTTELSTMILRTTELFYANQTYYLTINKENPDFSYRIIQITRIAQCPDLNSENVEIYSVPVNVVTKATVYIKGRQTNDKYKLKTSSNGNLSTTCGPNKFGYNCSKICSVYTTYCQNMIFCDSLNGCGCSSGFTGPYCNEKCPAGFYGIECQQKCSENCIKCDEYTGICLSGCKNNYVLPYCKEKYPWLLKPPTLVSKDIQSLTINISFHHSNIGGYTEKLPVMYILSYKNSSEHSVTYKWDYESYKIVTLRNLQPGTAYEVGVFLISEDGQINQDIQFTSLSTSCSIKLNMIHNVTLMNNENYVEVRWLKKNELNIDECQVIEYTLILTSNPGSIEEKSIYINKTSNEHRFYNLIPAHFYAVRVIAVTVEGPSNPSKLYYFTTKPRGEIRIENLKAINDDLNPTAKIISWELIDKNFNLPISYKIMYRVNRYFGCHFVPTVYNWTQFIVHNKTDITIKDLTPNTQYTLNVHPITSNYTYDEAENTLIFKTEPSIPELAPIFLERQPIFVNNDTVTIDMLSFNPEDCVKLNGNLRGFHLTLKNLTDNSVSELITENPVIQFTNLMSKTKYELFAHLLTNEGYNPSYNLSISFKTKAISLPAVEELSVYKKDNKKRSVSLRWSYITDLEVNGFILTYLTNNKTVNMERFIIKPTKCIAWPTMYCTTISNLIPNTHNTVKIQAKSIDYPMGGLIASISFHTVEGSPDEPGNLRASYVGSTNITIEWDIPWNFNGILNSFIVNIEEIAAEDMDMCCVSFPDVELKIIEEKPSYNYTINNLKSGSTYIIGVLTKTSWYGQSKRIHVTTLSDKSLNIKEN